LKLLENWENDYWERVKNQTILFPETEKTLKSLVSEYQVALITNAQEQKNSSNHRLSQFPELKRLFEVVVIAGESDVPAKRGQPALPGADPTTGPAKVMG